jgi:hypothetical protein
MKVSFPETQVNSVLIEGERYISQRDLAEWFSKIADATPELNEVFNYLIRLMATSTPVK